MNTLESATHETVPAPIELMKALALFQYECPIIHKSTKGYGYSYADLPTIIETITPILKKNGLGFTQLVQGENIVTFVFHAESGQSIESSMKIEPIEMKGMNSLQSYGACLSYFRRYSLICILGIVSDQDTDAQGQPKKMASKKDPNEKEKLNHKQFIRAMAEIQSGKYTKEFILNAFDLTEEQILTIDEMNV